MFDQISERVWLLVLLAILAYRPARYVIKHILASPSRRDITLPKEDLSWRTPARLFRSLVALAAFLGLAFFIYTPAAEQFARSPQFLPVLMGAFASWAFITVGQALAEGKIKPLARGFSQAYSRASRPKAFWASLIWNAALGSAFTWLSYEGFVNAPRDALRSACFDDEKQRAPNERISACTKLISDPKSSPEDVEDYFSNRGIAYYLRGDLERARADYDEAIRREPDDDSTFYNRALVHRQQGNLPAAIADFSTAIRLDPDDMDAYFERGIAYLDMGRLDDALADLSQAHRLKPSDVWPLANRGLAYVWKGDLTRAAIDFNTVRRTDPANIVVLRGEALMAIQAGDWKTAVQRLSAALAQDPNDEWSLRQRAYVYERLGEEKKRYDDLDRLWRLTTERRAHQNSQ